MNENRPPPDTTRRRWRTLEKKLHLVRDHVTAVARGYKTGITCTAPAAWASPTPSCGTWNSLDVPYQLFNSRMTAKGLFLALQRAPDAIHVLEDMERLTKDPDAQGVLRSALWRSRATTVS